jgi:hypothetical protein
MTGREKIEAAFAQGGTSQVPAVICYEGIYIRDHWGELTERPWWWTESPDIEQQLAWRRDAITRTGQDWFYLPTTFPRQRRQGMRIEERGTGMYLVDPDGRPRRLEEPQVAGWNALGRNESIHPTHPALNIEEIDAQVPLPEPQDHGDGRGDLAAAMLAGFGSDLFPLVHVASPLWLTYNIWGFEGMMHMIAGQPDLVRYACERYLARSLEQVRAAAALGAAGIWIEECLTDMIGPEAFQALNLPYVTRLVDEIRANGMKSIYYYCGNPSGKWDMLFATGCDALSLEESKKGFEIDISEAAERSQGRCALLGNLDAIELLPNGSEDEIRREILRQIEAGRRNGGRFIMSLGSPVTPGTPVERVRWYCDTVHELGG